MKMWHSIEKDVVLKELKSSMDGLSFKEAQYRLQTYGKNEIPHKKGDSFLKIMGRQLVDPIVFLLFVATFFSFFIGEIVDGIAIAFIILIDLLMGSVQEWKASLSAEALSSMLREKVKVKREKEMVIDACDVVIGDIVLLESGDKICADMRVLESYNLTVEESILTGESIGALKGELMLPFRTILADRKNMLYGGTSVMTGRAVAVICATGKDTEIGKIADEVGHTKKTKSPLTIRMEKFSKQISFFIVVIAVLLTILLFMKKVDGNQIFLSVIALSVSAMPEGLPLALTMALTIASNRMAKKNVIVKKLNAVESLGSCTVIASDKTGTLTVNEQTAQKILLPSGDVFMVKDDSSHDTEKVLDRRGLIESARRIGKLGMINNEATFLEKDNTISYVGDSIDIAFLKLGRELGILKQNIEILNRIPYESENKYSALFYLEDGFSYGTVKGSFEKVLSFCDKMEVNGQIIQIDRDLLQKQNESLAKDGYRVIALAYRKDISSSYEEVDICHFIFAGMVAFMDPVRKEAKTSVMACKKAGIRVVMITGDHPLTAFFIAKQLGIVTSESEVTEGFEVSQKLKEGEGAFDHFVKGKNVFTRITPTEKLKIIESFKRMGDFVAVTGDGVNDAPAIQSANIGIAMGSGTDVAKETASMIITDDNFKSIVSGIKEGRNAYSNIRKVSYMLLSCGIAEVLFFLLAILFDYPMPLVAIQLLWLNIVTDGLQDFALSFEKAEDGIMEQMPRSPRESIFNKELFREVLLAGSVMGIIVFLTWIYLTSFLHMDIVSSRGYIMTLMVFLQNMHVLNCRSEKNSVFQTSLFSNPLVLFSIFSAIFLQILVCEIPILGRFFQIGRVPIFHMIFLFVLSFSIILVMEIYKKIGKNKELSKIKK